MYACKCVKRHHLAMGLFFYRILLPFYTLFFSHRIFSSFTTDIEYDEKNKKYKENDEMRNWEKKRRTAHVSLKGN
jgi:hypothetical protein